jgi:predicted Zn-dependent protease
MKSIIELLNENKKVSAWKLTEVETESCELFYVLKKLETNRATNNKDINLTIYVDKEGTRGSADIVIYSYMEEDEIRKAIEEGVYSASFAQNKFYEIPGPTDETIVSKVSNLSEKPFVNVIEDIVSAVFKADTHKEGWLNSTEFFLYKKNIHIRNSKGVDISYVRYYGNIEVIPTWKSEHEEVELYKMIEFGNLDLDYITKEVNDILLLAKLRSEAVTLPKGVKANILLSDEEAKEIVDYFVSDLSYMSEYTHMSISKIGESVQGEEIKGDLLNVKLVPSLVNSVRNAPVDRDGVVLKEIDVIKDGVALTRHGDYRFGYYLGEEHPTGSYSNMKVKCGTTSEEEMKKKPYIECLKFSGMQMDSFSGFFGGEVRLGIYFDGEKTYPVTGFSISGNIKEKRAELTLSKESISTSSGYEGPKYILVPGMDIA